MGSPLAIFVLSARDPATDFRRDLVAALRRAGHRVTYVRLAAASFVEGPEPGRTETLSPAAVLARLARESWAAPRMLVFNSVNLGFPLFSLLERVLTPRATWIFDLHDDLLYESTGLRRRIESLKLGLLRGMATFSVCCAPKLRDLYPDARVLPNASSLVRRPRPTVSASRVLILSNVDARFDFAFLREALAAAPETAFVLHGGVSRTAVARAELERLAGFANFTYEGNYTLDAMQGILDGFDVMLAPYALNRSTTYIDPLRIYHGLCAGLEIVVTPIPRALDFSDVVHLAEDGRDAVGIIRGLASGAVGARNVPGLHALTWDDRARDLVAYAQQAMA